MQICIFARQVKEGPAAGEFEERKYFENDVANTNLGKRSAGNWEKNTKRVSMRRGK